MITSMQIRANPPMNSMESVLCRKLSPTTGKGKGYVPLKVYTVYPYKQEWIKKEALMITRHANS